MAFSAQDLATLENAIDHMVDTQALELPVDATAVIPLLAQVAVNEGFCMGQGIFFEAMKNRPLSTLIKFVSFAAGSGLTLSPGVPL